MKRIALVGVILALAAAGFHHLSGTVEFSLWSLRRAIEANEVAEVERYVDVDAIAGEFVDAYLAGAQRQMDAELWGNPFAGLGSGMLDVARAHDAAAGSPLANRKAFPHLANCSRGPRFQKCRGGPTNARGRGRTFVALTRGLCS